MNADHFASKAITIGDGRPLGRFGGEPQTAHKSCGALKAAEKRVNKAQKGEIAKSAPDQMAKAHVMCGC